MAYFSDQLTGIKSKVHGLDCVDNADGTMTIQKSANAKSQSGSGSEAADLPAYLTEYHRYRKKLPEFPYKQHQYPKSLVEKVNTKLNVHMMPERTLRSLTGLSIFDFWKLVQLFAKSGVMMSDTKKHKLSLASFTLLHRYKMRKNPAARDLEQDFNLGYRTIQDYWWKAWVSICQYDNKVLKVWSDPLTTVDQRNAQYEKMRLADPLLAGIVDLFSDPNPKGKSLLIQIVEI